MLNDSFCHLHNHTEHSMLDGMGTCEQYARKAKQMGFKYLGCTDHGSVSGLIQFQKACDKEGIKPVLGCELYLVKDVADKTKENKPNHMTVFVKNEKGWQNLLQILSYANMEGFYRRPRVDSPYFLNHCEGLVILSGCIDSFLGAKWGHDFLMVLEDRIPDPWDLYFEVMPHDIEGQKEANKIALGLALETVAGTNLENAPPFVATNDCHYIEEEDWEAQEVLLAIQRSAKWSDPNRWRFGIKGLHLRSADEMIQAFKQQGVLEEDEIQSALECTLEVAKKCCDFRIKKQGISLPVVKGYEGDSDKLLRKLCEEGDKGVFLGSLFEDVYKERFEEEFKLITEKKFSQYFIIVKELVAWCEENAILVGPGRGSVGGCLIAYLLGITTVDPIKYSLLFSRFIAEDRGDLPDIDLDFEDNKRHLVRQHLENMYGSNNVANIATFLRMKGRGAVRDVCRVFDVSLKEVDEFAKTIDDGGDKREDTRIEEAIKGTNVGRTFARKYPKVVKFAQKLEGQVRGYGKHAAGIIVSAEDLTQGTRCNLIKRGDEGVAINWEMYDAEHVGLMKLDILGLSTLTVLGECQRLIKENQGIALEFESIPLNDSKVYKDLSQGNTVGTFQFSGYSCTDLIKRMGVNKFEDLALAISLARPGPAESGMMDLFVERRKGASWKKKHPIYEEITKDTYGVLVYQEQVMEVIYKVAGLPYSTADKIRKVVGKKRDAKEFDPYRIQFMEGCLKAGTFNRAEVNEFWKGLLEWAHYGFCKAHAVEYALIGYWTAWLKLNYPREFLCATLTYEPDSKKNALVKEAYRLGFDVMPPKAGISEPLRWIVKGTTLYVPFIAIKGIGEKKALQASGIKNKGPNKEQAGFFTALKGKVKETQLEGLLREIGAFEPGIPKGISQHFSFTISTDMRVLYPNLFKVFPNIRPGQVDEIVKGKFPFPEIFKKTRFDNDYLLDCNDCELRKECQGPVMPSKGFYNIIIAGEGPGCISGDTFIDVAFRDKSVHFEGIKIKDLVGAKGFLVYSYDIKENKLVLGRVKKVWKTGRKKVYKIKYEWWFSRDGIKKENSIKVTSNHCFLLKDGRWRRNVFANKKFKKKYVSIDDGLCIGIGIEPLNRGIDGDYSYLGANGMNIKESRFLLEHKLGRKLIGEEQCHHHDENKLNDTWGNLKLENIDDHSRYHSIKNNVMFNPQVREKHQKIVQSDKYRQKMSRKMKDVLKDPKIYAKRLEQLERDKGKISDTLKQKYKNPEFYYLYLLNHKKTLKYVKNPDEWVQRKFFERFPNESLPFNNHKIISIEEIGIEDVYDMEVERYHNFAANGIFVHNSQEDLQGEGFVGAAGKDILWPEFAKYGLKRIKFHVSNAIKCYPRVSKTPNKVHIQKCLPWLQEEMEAIECRLMLVFGNTGVRAFLDEDGGITKKNGTTEWVDRWKTWICWCVHPASVLHNPKANREYFQAGIKNFVETIKSLGGVDEILF